MKQFSIYCITNGVNGKRYIGLTTTSIKKRWSIHTFYAKNGSTTALGCAIRKYGGENFIIEHILCCSSWEDLKKSEIYIIEARNTFSPIGYNLTKGGDGVFGSIQSEETIKKRVAKLTGRKLSEEHKEKLLTAWKGKKHTEATKFALSEARKGRPQSAEHRAKRSESMRGNANFSGHTHTEETKAKMSAAQKGKPKHYMIELNKSAESRKKRGDGLKGRIFTEEHRANIGASRKGKPHTEEAREKIREASKTIWIYRKLRAEVEMIAAAGCHA